MSLSGTTNGEEPDNSLKKKLEHIASEIKISWIRDCDKTDSMIALNDFISNILDKDISLEEVFNNDEKLLQYFMNDFMKEVINNIIIQPIVYGDNGDDIALNLLFNLYKLFLKYHQNKKYSPLFERLRDIVNTEKSSSHFFMPPNDNKNQMQKIENPKRKLNYYNFNHQFCSDYIDKTKENDNILKEGDNIDVLIKYEKSRTQLDRKGWVRGKIKSVDKENYNYIVEIPELKTDITVQIQSYEIAPEGSKTQDWEWRRNLKKYDLIDCYDRNKWYPSTVCEVNETILENGYKMISYKVGFRVYPKYFKNKNDENDKYENYKCFWEGHQLELEEGKNEEYYGDKVNYDETIDFYSKRIQKFQSYTNTQKEYLNQPTQYSAYGSYNKSTGNKMQLMNYNLENDGEENEINEDIFIYEINGKKNYIFGKSGKFSFYYAQFLKKLADENVFEEFIKIILNKPNSEEIFTIFFTLYYALPYLHKQYLIDNLDNFKNGIINFINNLDTKEIRSLPKDLIEMITKFLKKISKILKLDETKESETKESENAAKENTPTENAANENKENDAVNEKEKSDKKETKKDTLSVIDEITINLSIKMIKTSIFDKRIQGIKALNDYIEENHKKESAMKIVVDLIQKNEIIKEIFGANYHSQIISKSNKILALLLQKNEVKEEDIKLIWDCTQRGDLEAKSTIMKLLSDLAENLNENFINILLQNIINTFDKNKINEKEIDFIYNLSIHGDNENNKIKCCEYLYHCILKLDLADNIQKNPIMEKLVSLSGKDDKFLSKVLSMCENDLKANNSSLIILQILSAIFERYSFCHTEIYYLKDYLKEFNKDEHLLTLFKDNFSSYIQRIKELIKEKNKTEPDKIGNYDDLIIDNYSHVINIQKRIEFLKDYLIFIYPNFDFVQYLKNILIDNPISINDGSLFYEFMKKYISESKANESQEQKDKRDNIKNQLFKILAENKQNSMTMSEFKLFVAIFLGINDPYIYYTIDNDDNYDIKLLCDNVEQLKDLDKLWNVIFQLKDEKVLNKSIEILFNIYQSKDQTEKLLNKCNELIKDEKTSSEIIDKCFKILRTIIVELEKNYIPQAKSHSNLIKNSLIYLPIKLSPKYPSFYSSNENTDNFSEIFYGNTTLGEIKEFLIQKGRLPLKYIEIFLSKEYMTKIKEKEKNKDKSKDNKNEEKELLLDETYNNKSILDILNNNYNLDLLPNKIFLFYKKPIPRANLLEGNELNPKFKEILKDWFNDFTEGTGKMNAKGCARYISNVTSSKEGVPENDDRIERFFRAYDKENLGYITEDKFVEFYHDCLSSNKDATVWENLTYMGIREDLLKKDENDEIPYIENNKLPRYTLGNDKNFLETLFNMYNKVENKKDIFEFLFFLTTNKEIYSNILNNLNKKDEKNFEKIFDDNKKILEQLYVLTIIESILQDININCIDFSILFENCKKKENRAESHIVMRSKNYEFFDDFEMSKKEDFLKEFIINNNYEKLLNYMDKLLTEYKFDDNENDNIVLNLCSEKCLKVINILYNACFDIKVGNEQKEEKDNMPNDNGILILDCNNLSKIINNDENTKKSLSQISFLDFTTNLIKFVSNMNNYLLKNEKNANNENENNNNLLQNSFNLLINLISCNEKLLNELDSQEEIKHMLSSSIKSSLNCPNEYYKSFYLKCLLNSIKNISSSDNKYLNLLFEPTNEIFNEMMEEKSVKNNKNISSKSSILFFDFFSILTSTKTDKAGNEFLFKIYNILFNYLIGNENEKKISKDNFIGFMNILIKRIKNNPDIKNSIITKEIEGKTLIELILEKLYKNEENEKEKENEKNELITTETINTDEEPKFINLDTIQPEKPKENNELTKEIKDICNDYLIECFKSSKDPKIMKELSAIIKLLNEKSPESEENGQTKQKTSISTKKLGHVGLKNIGCICYMNSIMQQMYMVPTFRYAIMGSDDHEDPKPAENGRISIDDDNLLHQLQIMYTFLTYSEKEDYNPKNFCFSFKDFDGNPTNPIIQQDSQEFFNNFCDKIENCLKKTKYKSIINDVFTGRTCSSVICESCKNVSNRFEDFYNLSLEVKNLNNLSDSLQKMISPEKIDDFKCSNCNKNVTISKITSLCDLPNILFIHLKRFYMNYEIERTEKINSRFEFPLNLNLKKFCIEDIVTQISSKKFEDDDIYDKEDDYYNYELKGINIHMGSADGGHYFSLINIERDGKGNILIEKKDEKGETEKDNKDENKKTKWLKFNDSKLSIFDINDIEKECFGGARKGSGYNFENFQNAYMLIYERKKKSPIRVYYEDNEKKAINKDDNDNIKINENNKKEIKKKFDLFKNNSNIDETSLYTKLFIDEEKDEYYKYIPYYDIEKYAPRKIYNQVMEKNKQIENMKNDNESDYNKYKKDYYEVLFNNISSEDFDILSEEYKPDIKKELLNILVESIFSLISNKFPSEMLNSKTKIILEKIVAPFINQYLNENVKNKTDSTSYGQNYIYILILCNIIINKEKLEKIYVNDLTAVFDKDNVILFSKIIKGLLVANYKKNENRYMSIIEDLYNLIQAIDNTSTYPTVANNQTNKTPLYYIYEILYQAALEDKKTTEKLLNQSAISTFLGKIPDEHVLCKNVLYDFVIYLLKNLKDYNDKLFDDIKDNDKKCNNYFHEKNFIIKKISSNIVEMLYDEKIELFIILIKMLQYNELNFSLDFNIKNIYQLFDFSFAKNKICDMVKILFAILEINDNVTFHRLNYILGYPTLVIKQVEKKDIEEEKNNDVNEEKKENEEEENKNKNVEKEKNNYWPLFGERLIMEENDQTPENNNDSKNKLKKHIFKYTGPIQKKPHYCLLSLLFPYKESKIGEKQRIQFIYDLLKLMLMGKGNYCVFKYIYLLPARSIYYNNLYEEMIDIIEEDNKINNNLYNLDEIKQNAELCIKRINYEVYKTINDLKNNNIYYDDYKNDEKYKLPEKMAKYYIDSDDAEKFIGSNPNMILSDILKEEIQIIAAGSNMFLIRLEYFTKYKTRDEIRYNINKLTNNNEKEKEIKLEDTKAEEKKEEAKKEGEEKKEEEIELKKNLYEEENKSESPRSSDEDDNRVLKIDISDIKEEVDGKDFIFDITKKLQRLTKVVIEDPTIKNKKNVKSSLIRFIIVSTQSSDSDMHIKILEKDIPSDVRENYYYSNFFIDSIKKKNISNFCNLYRIRNDIPFLKNNHIGINIDIKKPRDDE